MTNDTLYKEFTAIYLIHNSFDQYLALRKFNKQYKTSLFYKQTHYSIMKAFHIFCVSKNNYCIKILADLVSPNELADRFNTFIEEIDTDQINLILSSLIDKMDLTTLTKDKEFLTEAIQKLQI